MTNKERIRNQLIDYLKTEIDEHQIVRAAQLRDVVLYRFYVKPKNIKLHLYRDIDITVEAQGDLNEEGIADSILKNFDLDFKGYCHECTAYDEETHSDRSGCTWRHKQVDPEDEQCEYSEWIDGQLQPKKWDANCEVCRLESICKFAVPEKIMSPVLKGCKFFDNIQEQNQ